MEVLPKKKILKVQVVSYTLHGSTAEEENSESTGREIVAFWNWDRKNYFVR